jgi:hypothetical protein
MRVVCCGRILLYCVPDRTWDMGAPRYYACIDLIWDISSKGRYGIELREVLFEAQLYGSNPILHCPLPLRITPLQYSVNFLSLLLSRLASHMHMEHGTSSIAHRTSHIAQLKTSLRCVYYWTKRGNTLAHLYFASWHEHSTPPCVADDKPLTSLPRHLQQ